MFSISRPVAPRVTLVAAYVPKHRLCAPSPLGRPLVFRAAAIGGARPSMRLPLDSTSERGCVPLPAGRCSRPLLRTASHLIGERNYRENLLGTPFRLPSVDRHPIFCGHGGNAFFDASCHRELIKKGDCGHAHHQSLGRGVSADAFGELYWLPD